MNDHVEAEFVEEQPQGAALAVREEQQIAQAGLFRTDDPVEVIEKATRVADALKAVVVSKNLVSKIQNKEYPQVEAWLTLAAMLNVHPVIEWTRKTENGWEARCIVRNGQGVEIGGAEAQCTRSESSWSRRDDYALRSMAQTRATSKALRNKLGFIMTLAGYQATPAEEMPADGESSQGGDSRRMTDAQKAVMFCQRLGFSDNNRRSYIKQFYGVDSFNDLDKEQLRAVCEHFKNLKREERDAS